MPDTILDHQALEGYLPHRGVNLMPDTVTLIEGGTRAESRTTIPDADPRGRNLHGRGEAASTSRVWYEPMLAELMALTGVPLLHERLAANRQVAVFSMISKLVFHRTAPMGREVIGHAEITRDRGAFTVFSTRATVDGQPILEAEVMSGCAPLEAITGKALAVPQDIPAGAAIDPAWFTWKAEPLRFAATIVSEDQAQGRLVAGYRYEPDHPFVPGHFPAGPLMMGVTQWAAVADATWVAMRRFGLTACLAQGTIRRPEGGEILDVRDLELVDEGGIPRIASTKRIAFRDKVVPGQSILIEVSLVPR